MSSGVPLKIGKALAARTDLTSTAKLAHAAIVDRMGRNGQSWPGLPTLAEDIGVCRSTAQQAVLDLERAGLLMVERRAGCVHHYRLPTADPSEIQTGTRLLFGPEPD